MITTRWEAALDRVLELTVLLGRDMTESLAREGLTESRARLLWELQRRGPCTQRVLADACHVTPRTITALVDGLVSTGFVTREPHPSDRRATLVTLTTRGHETAETFVEGHRQLARQLFGDLPAAVFDGFDTGLLQVLDRLRRLLATQLPMFCDGWLSSTKGETMLDHLGLDVSDFDRSKAFYQAALAPLGITLLMEPAPGIAGFGEGQKPFFWIGRRGRPAQTGVHIAFAVSSRELVDAFHAAALEAGATDKGGPGVRELYHPDYYGAFVLDPDGNNVEAVCHH